MTGTSKLESSNLHLQNYMANSSIVVTAVVITVVAVVPLTVVVVTVETVVVTSVVQVLQLLLTCTQINRSQRSQFPCSSTTIDRFRDPTIPN